jgi:hypothetical protein
MRRLLINLLKAGLLFLVFCALLGSGNPEQCLDATTHWLKENQRNVLIALAVLAGLYYLTHSNENFEPERLYNWEHHRLSKQKEDDYFNYYTNFMKGLYETNDPHTLNKMLCELDSLSKANGGEFVKWVEAMDYADKFKDLISYAREKMKYYPEENLPRCSSNYT